MMLANTILRWKTVALTIGVLSILANILLIAVLIIPIGSFWGELHLHETPGEFLYSFASEVSLRLYYLEFSFFTKVFYTITRVYHRNSHINNLTNNKPFTFLF